MVRCPTCGNENPPEYPLEEYPFCIECGTQLGPFRPPPMPQQGNPYGPGPGGPYGGPPGGGPPGGGPPNQYGPGPGNPYGGGQPDGQWGGGPPPQYGGGGPPPQGPPPQFGGGGPQQPQYGGGGPQQPQYGGGGPPAPYEAGREITPFMPAGSGAAKLVLESGAGKLEYPLDSPVTTIGRSRSNDISLEDTRVSRHHARVVRDERGYAIEDLSSRNGTRVDDRAVRDSTPLTDGAVVRIGDAVFRFTTAPAQGPGGGPQPGPAQWGGPGGGPGPQPGPQQGPIPWGAQGPQAGPGPQPGPDPWGNPMGGPPGGGPPGGGPSYGAAVPVVYMSQWNPVQCPQCQGQRTMIQVVYGPAAQTPGAQAAAGRGEIILGEGPAYPDAPNAQCRTCGIRVRIVQSGS